MSVVGERRLWTNTPQELLIVIFFLFVRIELMNWIKTLNFFFLSFSIVIKIYFIQRWCDQWSAVCVCVCVWWWHESQINVQDEYILFSFLSLFFFYFVKIITWFCQWALYVFFHYILVDQWSTCAIYILKRRKKTRVTVFFFINQTQHELNDILYLRAWVRV